MSKKRPVIAAIPHYNMPETLVRLVGQTIEQDYDGVYVLDDKSTNCDIHEILRPFGKAVTLIAGTENVGAGGNRNRILQADPAKLRHSIIHFIDADCELTSKDIPYNTRRVFADGTIGAVGGLVINPDGVQYPYNYGPRMSWMFGVSVRLQTVIAYAARHNAGRAKKLQRAFGGTLIGWPDLAPEQHAQDVFYLTEANLLIPYSTFLEVGGFDQKLRFGEAQDLAQKLEQRGLRRRFDPQIAVKHHAVRIANKRRVRAELAGTLHLVRKYGLPWK